MKKIILTAIITAIITAAAVTNYIIKNQEISGTTGNYTVEIMGSQFNYR